jgi:hypothetical protein
MNEEVDNIVKKLVRFKITLKELEEIAPLVNSADFKEDYEISEDLHSVMQQEGREELQNEIKELINKEKEVIKAGKIIQLRDIRYQIAAACILGIFSVAVFTATTGYNNENNFRKTYINK